MEYCVDAHWEEGTRSIAVCVGYTVAIVGGGRRGPIKIVPTVQCTRRTVAGSCLGFCPPLIITNEQIDEMIEKVAPAGCDIGSLQKREFTQVDIKVQLWI